MKKIIVSWQSGRNETVLVEVCEDDFVEITRAKLLGKAHRDGMPMPPDSIVVEHYKMGVVNCMRGGV
jgi:hypothetical protein